MAYAMTKQGSLDNCITYEFICDTTTDMNAIENRYRTIGTVAIVLQGESGGLEVFIASSNKQWNSLSAVGSSSESGAGAGLSIHICAQNEVSSGLPSISEPDESTIYLVASGSESGNLYEEYIYVNNAWEKFGAANIDLSGYAPIANPEFTGSISLNRKSGTTAGTESIAVGNETAANGDQTVAFGRSTISNGDASFTCGTGLVAAGGSEFVIGTYNKLPAQAWQPNTAYVMDDYVVYHDKLYYCASPHTSAATFEEDNGWYHARKYLLTIGNGNNSSGRGNAFVVDIWGNAHLLGDLYAGCSDDSTGGIKLAKVTDIPDTSVFATKDSPIFTNSVSMGRKDNTTVGYMSVAVGSNNEASGPQSFAEGSNTTAYGNQSHTEGLQTNATGNYSHAEGENTTAQGQHSHAEGIGGTYTNNGITYTAKAAGESSHTEGFYCLTEWNSSKKPGDHAEGQKTRATGGASHSEGNFTLASGDSSHAEGDNTTASGESAHSEGKNTTASGTQAHAEGLSTSATGIQSHAEGNASTAAGVYSHAEGLGGTYTASGTTYTSQAVGVTDHVEGYQCLTAMAQPGNHAEGYQTRATGGAAHAEGNVTIASGMHSHAEGSSTTASSNESHAEGNATTASGSYSHAEGYQTTSSNASSHSEGDLSTASGYASHAEGGGTIASGSTSHAEGGSSTASGSNAHAEGGSTIASGSGSHAEGANTVAAGAYSHAGGIGNVIDTYDNWSEWTANTEYSIGDKIKRTTTNNDVTTVNGYICKTDHTSSSTFVSAKWTNLNGKMNYAEIIGNGTSSDRSNARALDWNGNEYLMGDIYVGCNASSTSGTKLARIPDPPTTDGTYTLQATVASGVVTYTWVAGA